MSGYLKPDEPTVDVTCDGCGDTFTIYRRAVEEGQEKLCFACLRCGKGGRVPTRHLGSAARLDGAAERERCVPYDYLRECLGEVLHTAFRKGGQSKEADRIWYTIKAMPRDDWGRVLDWIVWCIRTSRNADAIRARAGEGDIDNPPVV